LGVGHRRRVRVHPYRIVKITSALDAIDEHYSSLADYNLTRSEYLERVAIEACLAVGWDFEDDPIFVDYAMKATEPECNRFMRERFILWVNNQPSTKGKLYK
jgi:hypothetical protein